jgi:hypothetical protein
VTTNLTCTPHSSGAGLYSVRSNILNNGQVLFTGGDNYADGVGGSAICAAIFDPQTNTLSTINPMTTERYLQSSTKMSDGRVLIAGGIVDNLGFHSYHGSAEIYDPRTGAFSTTGAMTDSRYGHSGTLMPNGEILIAGGANSDALAWVDLYDTLTAAFSRTGSLPSPRYLYAAALLPNAMTLVVGGNGGNGLNDALATADLYAPPNAVNIGMPLQGDIAFGSGVTIATEFNHPAAVEWIDVYIDGQFLAASPPETFTWNASKVAANGLHVISAKAFNSSGSLVGTASVDVNVANGPVALFWPKENAIVSHKVAIAATLQPGVSWVDFYIDGRIIRATPPTTIYWDSTTVANGKHTLSAKGFDSSNQLVGSDSVIVNVSN